MSKKEFLSKLKVKLTKYEDKGVEKVIQYYTEIIDDKLELGMSEREAVDSLGEMDDIVDSLMVDLIERDKNQPQEYCSKGEIKSPEPRRIKEPAIAKSQSQPQEESYDIFHDYDLIGKSGFKLNSALNRRFDCGYKFLGYSVVHYMMIVLKVLCGWIMTMSAVGIVVGGVVMAISVADTIGKIMLIGGTALLGAAILMIAMIIGIKIIGLLQELFHTIMRKTIDKRVLEVKYENKY